MLGMKTVYQYDFGYSSILSPLQVLILKNLFALKLCKTEVCFASVVYKGLS